MATINLVAGNLIDLEKFAKWCSDEGWVAEWFVENDVDLTEHDPEYIIKNSDLFGKIPTTDEHWYEWFTFYYTFKTDRSFRSETNHKWWTPSAFKYESGMLEDTFVVLGKLVKSYNGVQLGQVVNRMCRACAGCTLGKKCENHRKYNIAGIYDPPGSLNPNKIKGATVSASEFCGKCHHHFHTVPSPKKLGFHPDSVILCPICGRAEKFVVPGHVFDIPKILEPFVAGQGIYVMPKGIDD